MSFDQTPKKFDRIVGILIQLQSKKIVKAQDLAERFEVSLRTIYRDIRTLEACGVPIYSEAGIGYSLVDGYRLPPVMFTKEEAMSFITAEKLMQHFTDTNLKKHFQSALIKIKAVLKDSQKDWIESVESKMAVTPATHFFNKDIPDALEILIESIAEKKQVVMTYESVEAEHPSERTIEPVGVFHEHNFWYVMGYCHLRKDYRQFRADRILSISRSEKPFTKTHQDLEYYRKKPLTENKSLVRFKIDKSVSKFLHFNRNFYGFTKEIKHKDYVEMHFEVDYKNRGMARWFMMFADWADILEPEDFKQEVRDLMAKSLKRMEK